VTRPQNVTEKPERNKSPRETKEDHWKKRKVRSVKAKEPGTHDLRTIAVSPARPIEKNRGKVLTASRKEKKCVELHASAVDQ